MKRILAFVIILWCVPFVLYSQDSIEGVWILDVDKSVQIMGNDERAKFDNLPDHVKKHAKETMQDREFRFEKNGVVIVNWKAGTVQKQSKGTWSSDYAGRKITLFIEAESLEYTYEKPASNSLILKSEEGGGFFNNLLFNKSN